MREEFFRHRVLQHPKLGRVFIPVVELAINNTVRVIAIVDTGAVISLFPPGIAKLLGIDLKALPRLILTGITGTRLRARIARVKLSIGRIEFKARVSFSEQRPVPSVLGRLDVMDRLEIRLEKNGVRIIESS